MIFYATHMVQDWRWKGHWFRATYTTLQSAVDLDLSIVQLFIAKVIHTSLSGVSYRTVRNVLGALSKELRSQVQRGRLEWLLRGIYLNRLVLTA